MGLHCNNEQASGKLLSSTQIVLFLSTSTSYITNIVLVCTTSTNNTTEIALVCSTSTSNTTEIVLVCTTRTNNTTEIVLVCTTSTSSTTKIRSGQNSSSYYSGVQFRCRYRAPWHNIVVVSHIHPSFPVSSLDGLRILCSSQFIIVVLCSTFYLTSEMYIMTQN